MEKNKKKEESENILKKKCGIIMPIASHPDYPKEHWKEVLNILVEAIGETEFEPRLVSDDVAIGLIHERIVNNIYNDEIVVCDVSSKNPNVMFELGMRLAFDKPTIIIKDENTGYSFDTGVIEHLNYPSSLRFNKIVDFKKELIGKINATYAKSQTEKDFSPFLKRFGKTIVPAKIQETEIAESQYIISKLDILTDEIINLKRSQSNGVQGNEIRFGPITRRKYVGSIVRRFLETNSHLEEEFVLSNLIDLLREDVYKEFGFKASSREIGNAVSEFFEGKETPDIKEN